MIYVVLSYHLHWEDVQLLPRTPLWWVHWKKRLVLFKSKKHKNIGKILARIAYYSLKIKIFFVQHPKTKAKGV